MATLNGAGPGPAEGVRHRVLVADDEERLRDVLVRILGEAGIDADTAADGRQAAMMTLSGFYDLVILDLLMPGQTGFAALRQIMSRRPDQPVLVLSCLSDPMSKMASLGLGADDYVLKPFHVGELVARVQARLRAAARPGTAVLSRGRLTLDVLARRADAGSGPVTLTRRETRLLWELMRRPGVVISAEDLLARVWGPDSDAAASLVDVYIRRLRCRLGDDAIITVPGAGYCASPG